MILNGYKILRINSVVLDHELGNISPSRFSHLFLKLGDMLRCQKIKSLSYTRSVSPMRVYYATRNSIYLSNKYPNSEIKEFSRKFAFFNGISSLLRGKNKVKILQAIVKGFTNDSYRAL